MTDETSHCFCQYYLFIRVEYCVVCCCYEIELCGGKSLSKITLESTTSRKTQAMGAKQKNVKIPTKTIPFRKDFFRATKEPNESTEEWLSRVKELAKSCCFGTHSNQFIVSKFIIGLESEVIEYLCSNAQSLDIQSTIKSVNVYEKEKDDSTHNATPFVDVTEPLIEPPDESVY